MTVSEPEWTNFELDLNTSHVRTKRELPKVRTIETAIFVDQYLSQRFSGRLNDLKRLVMAIMNEVQLIYNYKSMKTPLKIVIVKYEVSNRLYEVQCSHFPVIGTYQ